MPRTVTRYIRKTNRGTNKKQELSVQKALCRYIRAEYPQIKDFFNDWSAGAYLSPFQARERASMSSGRGWADLFIPYPSRGYHGLFLELKKEGTTIYVTRGPRKGALSADEQIQVEAEFLKRMNDNGYFARFAVGFDRAKEILDRYMDRPENETLF